MLSVLRKVKGLQCRDLYFHREAAQQSIGEDVQNHVQSAQCAAHAEPFFSLIVNLAEDAQSIAAGLSKRLATDIRRARDRDRVQAVVMEAPAAHDIESFCAFYDDVAKPKGLAGANSDKLVELAKSGGLVLAASTEPKSKAWLSSHAYICDGKRARVLYSASKSNHPESRYRNMVGRANKYLHWHMMLYFKDRDYSEYDFGGLSKKQELGSIDRFKMSFGGQETLEYNFVKGISLKGKIAVFLYHSRKKLAPRKRLHPR